MVGKILNCIFNSKMGVDINPESNYYAEQNGKHKMTLTSREDVIIGEGVSKSVEKNTVRGTGIKNLKFFRPEAFRVHHDNVFP